MLGDLDVSFLGKASGNAMDARPKFLRHLRKFHRMAGREDTLREFLLVVGLLVEVVG